MHGGTNDLCVEEFSAGESSATRTLARNGVAGIVGLGFRRWWSLSIGCCCRLLVRKWYATPRLKSRHATDRLHDKPKAACGPTAVSDAAKDCEEQSTQASSS